MHPLIDDLKELGTVDLDTYDAQTDATSCTRAVLLWIINDFHAYAMLPG